MRTKLRNMWQNLKNKREQVAKDEGSGLITILGVTMVVAIVATSVTMSAAVSTNFTYTQLNAQQASDFSDAAMADAVSMLSNDDMGYNACFYEHNDGKVSTKNYNYTIYRSSGATVPVNGIDDPQVKQGCPTDIDNWVLIKVDGKGRQDTLHSETAVYKIAKFNEEYLPHALQAGKMDLNAVGSLSVAQGVLASQPTIFIDDGDSNSASNPFLNCKSSTPINANIFLNNTNTEQTVNFPVASNECHINGDVIANGAINLRASGMYNGDVCSHSTVGSSAYAKGTVEQNASDCGFYGTMYGYVPQPSVIEKPFTDQSRHCRWSNIQSYLQSLEDDSHHIVDVSICSSTFGNTLPKQLELSSDITIINNNSASSSNNLSANLTVSSKDGKNHSFNIVRPSAEANDNASNVCTTTDYVTDVTYNKGVHGMIYTPCSLNVDKSNLIGQIYSGNKLTMAGNSSLSYMPSALVKAVEPINHDSYTAEQRYSNPHNPALVRVA